jgi:uncharacterized membrane protein
MVDLVLFFHLLGAFILVAGVAVAGVAHAAARRRDRPDEIALLLGLARVGVLFVGLGAATLLAFGFWLADLSGHSLGEPWLLAALVLFALTLGLGAAGGRRARRARKLAGQLAEGEQATTPELRRLLEDRNSETANHLAALMILVVIGLMVWRPGA